MSSWNRTTLAALCAASALILSACGDSRTVASPSGAASPSATSGASPSATSLRGKTVAVFVAAASDAYFSVSVKTIKAEAERMGAKVDVFDAAFDSSKQYSQIQDAITTGRYNAFLIAGLDGPAVASLVPTAVDAGIVVGGFNQPIGTDYNSTKPIDGVAFQVMRPYAEHGTTAGELVVEACAGIDPCRVGYFYIQKGAPFDTAERDNFDKAIARSPGVDIVAEGDTLSTRDGGLKAAQDMLIAHPDINVLVGTDPAILGAQQAAEQAGKTGALKYVSVAGTREAIAQVKAGTIFGTSISLPVDEARLLVGALAETIKTGKPLGGINPVTESKFPSGKIVQTNAADFEAQFGA